MIELRITRESAHLWHIVNADGYVIDTFTCKGDAERALANESGAW